MTNILITNGAGYIGSHSCLALAEKGYTPVVYGGLVNRHREFVQWGPFELGAVRDFQRRRSRSATMPKSEMNISCES